MDGRVIFRTEKYLRDFKRSLCLASSSSSAQLVSEDEGCCGHTKDCDEQSSVTPPNICLRWAVDCEGGVGLTGQTPPTQPSLASLAFWERRLLTAIELLLPGGHPRRAPAALFGVWLYSE
ncbi:hypothetical protein DdX_07378 [Ditylenchus destructor]|uniref:Uncharacterized protein n=1 Tax=Ditylenchus destructor TaxID=166010 RepID=A0AAD4N8I9_9BILA|nr:hypothetical protein DdX_07378 [Ditylenchus destructor]